MSLDSDSKLSNDKDKSFLDRRELNVIIIGESGVGKSALINLIYDKIVVESSNQAVGCTMDNAKVSGTLQNYPHLLLNLYDTAGLSESAEGNMPTIKAFVQLIKLCYAISNGIHLLVFCHKKGRISSEQFKTNYRIFKEELCENKVPALLVITHCDEPDDKPINHWWISNQESIRNRLKFDFVNGVCVSTKRNKSNDLDNIEESCIISRHNLITAIEEHALSRPMIIDSWKRKIINYIRTFYNAIAQWLGLQRASLRPELEQIFIDLNYSEDEARQETERLLKEIQKGDDKDPYKLVNVDDV